MLAAWTLLNRPDTEALRDELQRQFSALERESLRRVAALTLVYGSSAIFLPLWLVAVCAVASLCGEAIERWLQRDVARLIAEPWRYRLYLAGTLWLELAFITPPAVLWHLDGPYLKALAVALIFGAMLHAVTVLAIFRAGGVISAAAVAAVTLGSNTLYWLWRDDWPGLALSTFYLLLALWYFGATLISNHDLHREIAAGRAEAQAANATKGRFLAQMSHELRSPMDAILGMARAELRNSRYEASRERLQVLITSAEGLKTVLDDILDLAAMQDGRMTIRPIVCDTRAELAASLALYAPYVEKAGLPLTLEFAPGLPTYAVFDPQRLRQCLSNLLSHASKNTRSGSIQVRASAPSVEKGLPTQLMIEVAVIGPGSTADQPLVPVAPLAQAGSALQPEGAPELGLSICRALARQMGGDLIVLANGAPPDANAAPGGTRFVLTLAAPLPSAGAKLPAAPTAMPAMPMSGKRVLVINDISVGSLAVIDCLRILGASVLEVADVAGALRVLANAPVDLVLLDNNLAEADRFAALRAIRALPGRTGRVPMVALTAAANADERGRLEAQGLDGYVAKPVTRATLIAELAPLLAKAAIAD
ncbi:MAG: histidine kinase dimerization/phospho-acceptor domain-containing protein [Pseudorhodobacter sp.]|nr:histidine kinase dimerization/phospho-acceptor domain-containing protein [Pseudorhodobacter sp.]